jgi:hypothetical protein
LFKTRYLDFVPKFRNLRGKWTGRDRVVDIMNETIEDHLMSDDLNRVDLNRVETIIDRGKCHLSDKKRGTRRQMTP